MNRDADKVIALNAAADAEAKEMGAHPLSNVKYPLALGWSGKTTPFLYRGYKYTRELSAVSGAMWVRYTHEPWDVSLPFQTGFKVTAETTLPAAYVVPAQWVKVIDVLAGAWGGDGTDDGGLDGRGGDVPVRRDDVAGAAV